MRVSVPDEVYYVRIQPNLGRESIGDGRHRSDESLIPRTSKVALNLPRPEHWTTLDQINP